MQVFLVALLESEITGPLQARIMLILRDQELSGKQIMEKLKIRSPGTIYPVLNSLRERGLIDYRTEKHGSVRTKISFLTSRGRRELKHFLLQSARMFCCDFSIHLSRILDGLNEFVNLDRSQKILSTLDYIEVKEFLRGKNATYSTDLEVQTDTFDLVLSFAGVGSVIGWKPAEKHNHVKKLSDTLKPGGMAIIVEIEKTDNIFAKALFEDIIGLKESPGLERDEFENILSESGLQDIRVFSRSGLLYATGIR